MRRLILPFRFIKFRLIMNTSSVFTRQGAGTSDIRSLWYHLQEYPEMQMPVAMFENAHDASLAVAKEIAESIRQKADTGKPCVLGLATGSTPKGVYKQLIRMHREEGLSFKNVITFNLDEYYPIDPDEPQSYMRFMRHQLFDHVDIKPENIHVPDGTIAKKDVAAFCEKYESMIEEAGGLDLQILGIGRTGHIGFNEPGSGNASRTRLITLDHLTISDASGDFFGIDNVPRKAITMGVGTIMQSAKVILMAWGEGKSHIIKDAVEGPVTDSLPASYLQEHPDCAVVLDVASSAELARVKTPWLLGDCDWDANLILQATIWLGLHIEKPILKLTNRDFSDNGMVDLITEYDTAYNINIAVFNKLQRTITGWPGGKPKADDTHRPERAEPAHKRAVIFSPHPDDDVISMGGTFIRLRDQGHDVHVAYQTSGNLAVDNDEVVRFADFVNDMHESFGLEEDVTKTYLKQLRDTIRTKKPSDIDPPEIQKFKAMIRRGEAKAGCRFVGIPDENAHFLDMPFYETGEIEKNDIGQEDIDIIVNLLREIKPHQIFAAGNLSDPHGTHRVCLQAIFGALETCKEDDWAQDCYVWLYRGAWQEWDIHEIDMAVPLSPDELLRKRKAIFKHQSQKDRPLFPGPDSTEFWQRAERRNRNTANQYDQLGLAEYEAMEAFRRYDFLNRG